MFYKKPLLILVFLLLLPKVSTGQTITSYARAGAKTTLEIGWTADNYGTLQWQRSLDNGTTWTDIAGATTPVYEFTPITDALLRAKITPQDICDPVYLVRAVKTVSFNVDVLTVTANSIEFEVSGADFKNAGIVEYGFAYNISDLSSRDFRDMQRVKAGTGTPPGSSFIINSTGLNPGTNYNTRIYFKTADGSLIVGPSRLARTLPGLKWTNENWTITKNSISARFELVNYTSIMGNPDVVFKFGTSPANMETLSVTDQGNFKYATALKTGLNPNTTYIAQVQATVEGELQTITKQLKTLPDYSSVVVDQTTKPVGHTILWDQTKTLRQISPVGLQTEYPRIIRVSADTLLCTYHGGSGADYWVNIYVQKSYDNGRTWTSPTILMDKEKSAIGSRYWRFCNPEMIKLRNGWILLSFTANGNPETNFNCHTMIITSKDGGETWGDPIIMGRGRSWEPMIIQLPNDELELFVSSEAAWWQTAQQGPQEILFSRSTDNGQTWTELKRASYSPDRRDGMPVALVMQGNKGVLFSAEIVNDNGWGSPTLSRRGLAEEWDATPWNNVNTNKRWDVSMSAHGGAPYTIQLPTGEIVVMAHVNGRTVWQTSYPRVTVGDNNGKNFTTPVTPIPNLPSNEGAYYNSLLLKDKETVWLIITHSLYEGTTRKKGEIKYLEGKIVIKK